MRSKTASMVVLTLLLCGAASAQTVRNIPVPVKVSDDAINLFLAEQWSRLGWHTFSGSVAGCNYVLQLPTPTVTFTPGHGSLTLGVDITSNNCGGPWHADLTPTVAIPSGQLTTARVKMWLVDLFELIDGLPLPGWVKDALDRELGQRWGIPDLVDNLDAFPAPLLEELRTEFIEQRSVYLHPTNPFELAWQVDDGFLTLIPSVNLQSGYGAAVTPTFKARLWAWSADTDWLDIWANLEAKVSKVLIFDISGYINYYNLSPGVDTIKYRGDPDNDWIMIDLGDKKIYPSTNIYLVWILFEIDHTFYSREYKLPSATTGFTGSVGGYN